MLVHHPTEYGLGRMNFLNLSQLRIDLDFSCTLVFLSSLEWR